jgi:hypothetical protein
MAGAQTMGQSQVQICWHIIVCILQRLGLLEAMDFCVVNFRRFARKSWKKNNLLQITGLSKNNWPKNVKKGNIGQNLPQLHTT